MANVVDTLQVENPLSAPAATDATPGLMSAADKTKIDTVQTGATANSTDAQLRDRSTHTGTQAASTITGLAAVATSGLKADVGLGNVDNTSDANKPVSTAQQTALDLKANLASPTFTGTVSGITKAMVGLGNVDNTSDVNKPVSTAQQTALNLKYDASNPNGYETPAQLNARDTANRARANHTGTQLAATISDFAATVRSTVLTGYAVGANTVLAAADTVLGAFQKVQGQIDALIFGREYQYFEDLTSFNTTSVTLVSAALFPVAFVNTRVYRVEIQFTWSFDSVSTSALFALFINGAQVGDLMSIENGDTTDVTISQIWHRFTAPSTGNLNVELRAQSESGAIVTVPTVRCEVWRVS